MYNDSILSNIPDFMYITHAHTHIPAHTPTRTHTLSFTYTHTQARTLTYTHTHTHTLTYTHIHAHTREMAQSGCERRKTSQCGYQQEISTGVHMRGIEAYERKDLAMRISTFSSDCAVTEDSSPIFASICLWHLCVHPVFAIFRKRLREMHHAT